MKPVEYLVAISAFIAISSAPYLLFAFLNLNLNMFQWDSIIRGLYGVLQFVWVVWGARNMINNY